LLTDAQGQVLAQAGLAKGVSVESVLPVLLEEASLTARLNDFLKEGVEVSLHHYEGGRCQVHAAVATDVPILLIVFSETISSSRAGIAWLFLRRAMQELRGLLGPDGADGLGTSPSAASSGGLTLPQARALGLLPEEQETEEHRSPNS
jgi:hypothetical protein